MTTSTKPEIVDPFDPWPSAAAPDPARAPPPPGHQDGPYCSRATASVPLSRPVGHDQPARPALLIPPPGESHPLLLPGGLGRRGQALWNAYPLAEDRPIASISLWHWTARLKSTL